MSQTFDQALSGLWSVSLWRTKLGWVRSSDVSNANRCDAYVVARKQITMHEAPNILIVTLKRFKVGSICHLQYF